MPSSGCRLLAIAAVVAGLLTGSPLPADAQREQDHDQLRALARTVKEAVNANRLDDLLPLLAKGFSITMVDQTLVTQPGQIKEYFRRYFEAPDAVLKSVRIEPEADVLTEFLDESTGVNRGSSTDTYTLRNGRQVVFRTRWSGTFRKYDDQWKIVNLHVGTNFLDNPLLQAAEATRYLWGAGGLLLGVVAGGLGGWWLTRRRGPAPRP
jgi:hypothetical protein